MSSWRDNAGIILDNLEEKALKSFILGVFPDFKQHVPDTYRSIFENTTNPRIEVSATPSLQPEPDFQIYFRRPETSETQSAIIEHYFKLACEAGYSTAIENLFNLASLRFSDDRWKPYREENAILQGTLVFAIRFKLLPQVQKIAGYVQQRGIDLLDLPNEI